MNPYSLILWQKCFQFCIVYKYSFISSNEQLLEQNSFIIKLLIFAKILLRHLIVRTLSIYHLNKIQERKNNEKNHEAKFSLIQEEIHLRWIVMCESIVFIPWTCFKSTISRFFDNNQCLASHYFFSMLILCFLTDVLENLSPISLNDHAFPQSFISNAIGLPSCVVIT